MAENFAGYQSMFFNQDDLKRLKAAYAVAVKAGVDSFVFDGHELVTNYAKYMIEYLDSKIGDTASDLTKFRYGQKYGVRA